ncbi:MAG TPA: ion channel [Methylomirabilota bacterium]|nr:ion channel [Methylomirabilota bacterium]
MAPPNQIAVLNPLLIGIATTFCTIILHALLLGMIIWIVRRDLRLGRVGTRFWLDTIFITNVAMLLLAAHLAEIGLWALVLERCGEFSNFGAAYYHSAVNYTTLGDSAFAMSARWRLLAALEAGNGMLMFGVSTAAIFAVIQRLLQHRFGDPNATMQ